VEGGHEQSFINTDNRFEKENVKTTNRAQQIYIIYPSRCHPFRMQIKLRSFWRNTPNENVKE
jgi:hypothetical protein